VGADFSQIKALAFDVFGTLVDYRTSIIREGQQLSLKKGLAVNWGQLADAWRGKYRPNMDRVMRGELPKMSLDALHRMALEEVLLENEIEGFTEEEKEHFNLVWHRLLPWGDSVPGLTRLKSKYILTTLSNGSTSLLVNLAKHAGLPWDLILSSDLGGAFKPDPKMYQLVLDSLNLKPEQVMMVAAHPYDLLAAKSIGFQAAFVMRPLEHGAHAVPDLTADPSFEIVANDVVDLARQLGV